MLSPSNRLNVRERVIEIHGEHRIKVHRCMKLRLESRNTRVTLEKRFRVRAGGPIHRSSRLKSIDFITGILNTSRVRRIDILRDERELFASFQICQNHIINSNMAFHGWVLGESPLPVNNNPWSDVFANPWNNVLAVRRTYRNFKHGH